MKFPPRLSRSDFPSVLAIVGPTCSGKTDLSLRAARESAGEVVSADSRQVYRGMDIGTGKPGRRDLGEVRHHFIDILNPDEEYNAGRYGVEARRTVLSVLDGGKTPIIVGGSGLYIQAVIDGFFEGPARDPEIRDRLDQLLRTRGGDGLWEKLREVDPSSAKNIHPTQTRRLTRALEVLMATGKPISQWHAEQSREPLFNVRQIGIRWERAELYGRINERCERMMRDGLLGETEALKAKGYDGKLNSMNSVGYREALRHLEGKISRDEMLDEFKRNSRRFAKRQLTWFRADERITWLDAGGEGWLDNVWHQLRKAGNIVR